MPSYLSPGVYVEEVPPSARPIAGVGTSTAAFIGIVPDSFPKTIEIVRNETLGQGDGSTTTFNLKKYPVSISSGAFKISVNGKVTAATLSNNETTKSSQVTLNPAPAAGTSIVGDYVVVETFTPITAAGEVKLCTNFSEFEQFFGGFSIDPGQRYLAHAVYGFFNNGGTRCYVVRETSATPISTSTLKKLAAIDEISIVAAPGVVDSANRSAIITHCTTAKDRVAILDTGETIESNNSLDLMLLNQANTPNVLPDNSNYAALYFPWIQVADPATGSLQYVPPSGHIAGIYARNDSERGVFKAPGNEVVLGAVGLKYNISKNQQDGLNPQGVNVIRSLNGNIKVWGARTLGGDANGEFRYISTRRYFNFLRESIDEGTQFVVFEPNSPELWERIKRNVGDFLLTQWREGALFGETAKQAFYVKCDGETNPQRVREAGQIVTEIGVAIVKPAEFVIFRIQQTTGG